MGRDERWSSSARTSARRAASSARPRVSCDEFGDERVIDTPLTEAGIIGAAIGVALYGLRPVAEIQFADFIYPAYDQIVSEAARIRYRSDNKFGVPMVIRTPYGGGVHGGHYHSQSPEAYSSTSGAQGGVPRPRTTPRACFWPRSATTIRSCSSSTRRSTAVGARSPRATTPCRSGRRRSRTASQVTVVA